MKISVLGASIEGLVIAAALADTGNEVVLSDPWSESPVSLPGAISDLDEPGAASLLQRGLLNGRLQYEAELNSTFSSHVFVIAGRRIDSSRVIEMVEQCLWRNKGRVVIVVSAPLPLGALDEVRQAMQSFSSRHSIPEPDIVALPTFMREGSALRDWQNPSVMVVGTESDSALSLMQTLLRPNLQVAKHPMFVDCRTAEFMRFSFSAMLATRLSLMNELACLAETCGVDIELIREGLASDLRIGSEYLQPGCGFGGASLSRDLLTLNQAIKIQLDNSGLLDAVLTINESQKETLFRRLWRYYKTRLEDKRIAIWGAAFKPGTSSIEHSPVHEIIDGILSQGGVVTVYDPAAGDEMRVKYEQVANKVRIVEDRYTALIEADALLIVTAWNEFWSPDFERMLSLLREPLIFDGRNIYEPDYVESLGFRYFGIGRGRHI